MRLLVESPGSCSSEREYVLRVVLSEWMGLEWDWHPTDRSDILIRAHGDPMGAGIRLPDTFFRGASTAWLESTTVPTLPLEWSRSPSRIRGPCHVTPSCRSSSARPPPSWTPSIPRRPRFGSRSTCSGASSFSFRATRSWRLRRSSMTTGDFLTRRPSRTGPDSSKFPLADAYAELLAAAIHRLWPRAGLRQWEYQVVLSHDVDTPLARWAPDCARSCDRRAPIW